MEHHAVISCVPSNALWVSITVSRQRYISAVPRFYNSTYYHCLSLNSFLLKAAAATILQRLNTEEAAAGDGRMRNIALCILFLFGVITPIVIIYLRVKISETNLNSYSNPDPSKVILYFKLCLVLTLVYVTIAICVIAKTRQLVRARYHIPEKDCAGCEDCCCASFCTCCTLLQMEQQTAGLGRPGW